MSAVTNLEHNFDPTLFAIFRPINHIHAKIVQVVYSSAVYLN